MLETKVYLRTLDSPSNVDPIGDGFVYRTISNYFVHKDFNPTTLVNIKKYGFAIYHLGSIFIL